jgi:hypothetical protein
MLGEDDPRNHTKDHETQKPFFLILSFIHEQAKPNGCCTDISDTVLPDAQH